MDQERLQQACIRLIEGTSKAAEYVIDKTFRIIEAIAGRKVGVYILPVARIESLSLYGGQQARDAILGMRRPTLEELEAEYPGETALDDYRVVSVNPRDHHETFDNMKSKGKAQNAEDMV